MKKNNTGFQIFVIAFVLAALLFGDRAHGATCSDQAFRDSLQVSLALEVRSLKAGQRGDYYGALRSATSAWYNLRFGEQPCAKKLRRYRTVKIDFYLTLGAAFEAASQGQNDLANFLLDRALVKNRLATSILRSAS